MSGDEYPIIVEITRYHVIWQEKDPDQSIEDLVAELSEDPGDLLRDLDDLNAVDFDYNFDYFPGSPVVAAAMGSIGPTFPSGAWSQAEEDRHNAYVAMIERRRQEAAP